jgi:prephenate dehydrogenase
MWSVGQVVNEIARSGYTGLITDVVSVKSAVSQAVQQHLPGGRWIGGHPMVGSEKSGFTASSVTLLENCPWVLCLDRADQLPDWLWLAEWITSLGSRVVPTTLSEHDSVVARVSHLPHVLAAALTNVVAAGQMGDLALSVAAGSFRDATRVAASSPEATAAWCRANSQALSVELDAIAAQLDMFREAFKAATQSNSAVGPGSDVMTAWLRGAHQLRKAWPMPAGASRRVERSLAAISAIGRSGGWIASVNEKWITAVAPGVTPTNSSADKKV